MITIYGALLIKDYTGIIFSTNTMHPVKYEFISEKYRVAYG